MTPLGSVTATGQVHGTGFIGRGVETMTMRLVNQTGTIELNGKSGTVPGFTGP